MALSVTVFGGRMLPCVAKIDGWLWSEGSRALVVFFPQSGGDAFRLRKIKHEGVLLR